MPVCIIMRSPCRPSRQLYKPVHGVPVSYIYLSRDTESTQTSKGYMQRLHTSNKVTHKEYTRAIKEVYNFYLIFISIFVLICGYANNCNNKNPGSIHTKNTTLKGEGDTLNVTVTKLI